MAALPSKYTPDLAKHRFYLWLSDYHWIAPVVLAVVLYLAGGLPMLLWGGFLRTVVSLHGAWLVNSATHMWGSRRFATRDDSRNSWWVEVVLLVGPVLGYVNSAAISITPCIRRSLRQQSHR